MGRTLRTERYRFTLWDEQTGQLYDHQNDPRELVNLFGEAGHADVVKEMRQLLVGGWRGALPPAAQR